MKTTRWLIASCLGAVIAAAGGADAFADKIKHPTAVFAGLDKITGRIISFEVAINETVQFGSLQITPRVCFSRPKTEAPQTDVFAEVDEISPDKKTTRIFGGWMFADSPGLHGVEHPVYDVWLTDCKGDGPLIHEAPQIVETVPDPVDPAISPVGAANADPAKPQPPKKRKPKPAPAPAAADGPLDLTAPSAPPATANSARGGVAPLRRGAPADPGLVPPGNVGQ